MQERRIARLKRFRYPVADQHCAKRRITGGKSLGNRDDIRLIAETPAAEFVAEPAEGAYHFVGNQQHPVFITDFTDTLEITWRRKEARTGVLNWLKEDSGHGLWSLEFDYPGDLVGSPPAESWVIISMLGCTIEICVGDLQRAGNQWFEILLDGGYACYREGACRCPMVGKVPADHLVAGGHADKLEVLLRKLPRRLHRLAPADREEHLAEVPWRVGCQSLGELDRSRVGVGPDGEVAELPDLLGGRFGQFGPAVSDLDGE